MAIRNEELRRLLDQKEFERSRNYDAEWLVDEPMGANPLWLSEWLTRDIVLEPGMRVLDLGCGRAKSSIFLAREFGVQVWAVDLWTEASDNRRLIEEAGVADRVFPLHIDARSLPFAQDYFDAMIAIDSYQYYGNDDLYLNYVSQFVKPGGVMAFASAGLMQDFPDNHVPEHLQRFWSQDAWCVHTLDWWRAHWQRTGLVDIEHSDVMEDGWKRWHTWSIAVDASAWYREVLENDRGQYLGYLRMIGKRRENVDRWTPPNSEGVS